MASKIAKVIKTAERGVIWVLQIIDGTFQKATFAGGCFWCMEPPFDKLEGVLYTTAGYTGGFLDNPSYRIVCAGITGHAEAVRILYDPSQVSYTTLLDVFWRNIDPTTRDRQFVDAGTQYRTAIFFHDPEQKKLAEVSKQDLEASGLFEREIVTEIVPAKTFYEAESYHQQYYKNSPVQYYYYRAASGRDAYLEKVWGKEPTLKI